MEERDRIRRQALIVAASAAFGFALLCGIALIPLGLGVVDQSDWIDTAVRLGTLGAALFAVAGGLYAQGKRALAYVVTGFVVLGVATLVGVIVRRAQQPAVGIEAEPSSRSIHDQVEAAIGLFGKEVPPEKLPEVQKRAEQAFADALRSRGLDAARYRVLVHRDELVGPMCFVSEPSTGRSWPLPAFSGEADRGAKP